MEQGENQESKDLGKDAIDFPDLHREVVLFYEGFNPQCTLCKGDGVLQQLDKDGNEVVVRCILCMLIDRYTSDTMGFGEKLEGLTKKTQDEVNSAILKELQRRELMEE